MPNLKCSTIIVHAKIQVGNGFHAIEKIAVISWLMISFTLF